MEVGVFCAPPMPLWFMNRVAPQKTETASSTVARATRSNVGGTWRRSSSSSPRGAPPPVFPPPLPEPPEPKPPGPPEPLAPPAAPQPLPGPPLLLALPPVPAPLVAPPFALRQEACGEACGMGGGDGARGGGAGCGTVGRGADSIAESGGKARALGGGEDSGATGSVERGSAVVTSESPVRPREIVMSLRYCWSTRCRASRMLAALA